jgi:predicted amidohydrolase
MFIVCLVVCLKLIVVINGSKIADQCYRIIAFMLQKGELLQRRRKIWLFVAESNGAGASNARTSAAILRK